jgi:hypothetical protein
MVALNPAGGVYVASGFQFTSIVAGAFSSRQGGADEN